MGQAEAAAVHSASAARSWSGLGAAVISALIFGTSGTLAAGLLASGWTPLAAVTFRVIIGALTMGIPAAILLRGRWEILRPGWRNMLYYGLFAIAMPQLGMFSAVQYMQVAQALLIQYLAPVLLVGYLWIRRGERPSVGVIGGSVLAIFGLALVLQISVAGLALDWRGIGWALISLIGNAAYFVFSSDDKTGLPPAVLAGGGMAVCALVMAGIAVFGLLRFTISGDPVVYAGVAFPVWAPILVLGVLTAGVSYLTGIYAARILGTRLSSFVGLTEVLFAMFFATVLVGQVLSGGQLLGALLVISGIVLVRANY